MEYVVYIQTTCMNVRKAAGTRKFFNSGRFAATDQSAAYVLFKSFATPHTEDARYS